jgi:hypothetical protein
MKLLFTSIVFPSRSSEQNALLLTESIRTFAGSLSQTPIWFFMPEQGRQLSKSVKEKLLALNITLIPFKIDPENLQFPFTAQILATALAESMATDQADIIAWLDANTIVLQEPRELLLPDSKNLGYRPVHHTLVGSRYDEPLDPFWTLIYHHCNVPAHRVFPMKTHVDGTRIRPYFNAGFVITRPKKRLFQTWHDTFFRVYREPAFERFYQQDQRYTVFMHQAVITGVILSTFATDEIQQLPPAYNYPLHLHSQDVTDHRPNWLEELVTFRHEGFYNDPEWREKMPAKETLKQWIAERLLQPAHMNES